MSQFFVFLLLTSIGVLLLGLVSPKSLVPLVRRLWTRGKIATVFGGAAFFSFVAVGMTAPPIEEVSVRGEVVQAESVHENIVVEEAREEVAQEAPLVIEVVQEAQELTPAVAESPVKDVSVEEPKKSGTPVKQGDESEPGPQPEPEPAPVVRAPSCSCAANIYNCGDFSSHAAAQQVYACCMAQVGYDVHDLDRDNDGDACESL